MPVRARRTSNLDMRATGEMMFGGLVITGRARDVRLDGTAEVVDEAAVEAHLGDGRALEHLSTTPALADGQRLLGLPVAGGFRAAVAAVLPEHHSARTPLYLLLDDLPVAALISGYADIYLGRTPVTTRDGEIAVRENICAGWASDGTMVQAIHTEGRMPVPKGPPAPGDDGTWHELETLRPGMMRRQRRIDVTPGEPIIVDAMFRDTHADPEGEVTVLHEWSVAVEVEPRSLVVTAAAATAHALPWPECPSAHGSAGRLVGQPIDALRAFVGDELRGTTTCSHLNDLLRSLADVAALTPLAR